MNPFHSWEVRRVAAAFGGQPSHFPFFEGQGTSQYGGRIPASEDLAWECDLTLERGKIYLTRICVMGDKDWSGVRLMGYGTPWKMSYSDATYHERLVRGLYRLGFEEEDVMKQLPSLSAHEKLELRLSMPRLFWPELWKRKVA